MPKKTFVLLLCTVVFLSLSGCEKINSLNPFKKKNSPSSGYLAKVNNWTITPNEFQRRLEAIKATYNLEVVNPEDKKLVLNELIQREILAQEALRRGVDKQEKIKAAVEDFRKGLLVTQLASELIGNIEVSPQEIESYYRQYQESFKGAAQVKVKEIVVKSQEEAKTILIDLLADKFSFAMAAKEYSISDSAKDSGDLGFISQGEMFEKFDEIVFSLDKGAISSVFKGPKGYYIIKVEDKKEGEIVPLSEVYDDIKSFLRNQKQTQAVESLVSELKQKADIEIREDLLQ